MSLFILDAIFNDINIPQCICLYSPVDEHAGRFRFLTMGTGCQRHSCSCVLYTCKKCYRHKAVKMGNTWCCTPLPSVSLCVCLPLIFFSYAFREVVLYILSKVHDYYLWAGRSYRSSFSISRIHLKLR